jgi:archaetidylinositol phosphate synthase
MLSRLKPRITKVFMPTAVKLLKVGIKPNHLSAAGLITGVCSAIFISLGNISLGGMFFLLSGILDVLDGALARAAINITTPTFGGFLDSVFDRYVDIMILIALGIYGIDWLVISLAMSGTLLVSYTRAKAEILIEKCDIGIAERPDRFIILVVGMVSGFIYESVLLVSLISHFTALQRIFFTYKEYRTKGEIFQNKTKTGNNSIFPD